MFQYLLTTGGRGGEEEEEKKKKWEEEKSRSSKSGGDNGGQLVVKVVMCITALVQSCAYVTPQVALATNTKSLDRAAVSCSFFTTIIDFLG